MKNKVRFIVLWALITVVVTVASIIVQSNLTITTPKINIYKATKQIAIGTPITKADLIAKPIDLKDNLSDYVTDESEIVGLVAKQTIYEGEPINKERLISKSDPNYFVGKDNLRRFSIPTNYIDDPYSLTFRNGDVVDIIFTPLADGTSKALVSSQVIMKHVTVVGAINDTGVILTEKDKNTLATAILFESDTDTIQQITSNQYKGKYKFVKYPLNTQ